MVLDRGRPEQDVTSRDDYARSTDGMGRQSTETRQLSLGLNPIGLDASGLTARASVTGSGCGVGCTIERRETRNIRIRLTSTGDYAALVVVDDGVAFPKELPEDEGMGMKVVRHRAGVTDGVLTVEREPHGGTEVVCVLALKPELQTGEIKHG
jgi:hypothetical protein